MRPPGAPIGLTTEHAVTPLDVDVPAPRLSWRLPSNVSQCAYQIAVRDGWDSGLVESAEQLDVRYAGPPLRANTTYFWAVRVRYANGDLSPWSRLTRFETGLLAPDDWSARWIGRDDPPTAPRLGEQAPAPLLRKEFRLAGPIVRARLRIAGLGHYVAYLNGRRVGDQVLDPPPSAYATTVLYATHDVTKALRRGDNALGVTLGRGFFGTLADDVFDMGTVPWRGEPRLWAQLDVDYRDGGGVRVVSDDDWSMADGPALDGFSFGERYDARLAPPGWTRPGFDASGWVPAPVHSAPAARSGATTLRAAAIEPVRVVETLRPVAIGRPKPGVQVLDFGRTTAGWAALAVRAEAGTTVTLTYGETLNPDGTVVHGVLRHRPECTHVDTYTTRGTRTEVWEPSFVRHGFRYVQVSAGPVAPKALRVRARVSHSDVTTTGTFACSNWVLTTLHANQRATVLNNLWGFPSDTPWRDRQGWTADAFLYLDSAAYNFDVRRLYRQWLRSFRESQRRNGGLPVVVPNVLRHYNDPSWSGTLILTAWRLYEIYGDVEVLRDNYEAMTRWLKLMARLIAGSGRLYTGFSFGDWAAPGTENGGDELSFAPPEGSALTANADLYREARTLARIAGVLGQPDDVTRYGTLADQIGTAFNAAFFDPVAGVYRTPVETGYRQTSNLLPLAYGLVPTNHEKRVYENLVADLHARDDHLDTGTLGTKVLLPVLTEHGDVDLALRVATRTTYPGWGYWVSQGATTSWETWSHRSPRQSQGHPFLGTVVDWLYRDLAGIQPTAPGYATVRIRPAVPSTLDSVNATIGTPRGPLRTSWRREPDRFTLTVDLPGDTPTEVHLPGSAPRTVAGGRHTFRVHPYNR